MFACVEILVDRRDQAWSPFVATWHPGFEGFATELDSNFFTRSQLERAISRVASGHGTRELIDAIERFVRSEIEHARGADVSSLLDGARRSMQRSLFEILFIHDPASVQYLSPLVELSRRQGSLAVATLNYDRSVENVAELLGEPCDTGIETWLKSGTLSLPTRGVRLLKLHGSIDWVFERGALHGELPQQRIRKVSGAAEKSNSESPAIVFGEAGKLRAEGPFLELLLAWSAELQRADRLIVVGYSFRDPHVNEVLARWFNGDASRRIVVVDQATSTPANLNRSASG